MRIGEPKLIDGKLTIEYRYATMEEIAEMKRQAAEIPPPEPTPDERIAALEAQIAKLEQPKIVTDSIGNKYRQEIGEDGTVRLILIESYNGELFE